MCSSDLTDLYATGSSKEITEYQAAEKSGDVTVTIGTPSEPDLVMMNVRKAPLDDLRIRQALAGAVDIGRLYDFLEATGVKQPMHGPYADTSYWYVKSNYPDYDVEAAKALVAEYVAEKGSCEFEIAGNGTPWHVSYMELFQAMWDEIGCKVNITSRAQAENIDAVIGGNYQVILWGGIGGGDPDNDYNYFHSGGAMNFSGYSSPTIDAALEKGRALSDPEARKEQYAIVQKELGDVMPYIWTGTNQWGVVVRPNVLGLSDFDRKYSLNELVSSDVVFVATGVTPGALLDGVQKEMSADGEVFISTESLVMISRTQTIRKLYMRRPLQS